MEELIVIGETVKAQGIKGEIKIKPLTDDVNRYKKLRAVYLDNALFRIRGIRIADGFVYLSFIGVDDRNRAEELVGKEVKIDRIHAIIPDDGAYFIADVKGCRLFADDEEIGVISDVCSYGAADVFEVDLPDGKTMRFPFLNKLEAEVDVDAKIIKVNKRQLMNVAVYDV